MKKNLILCSVCAITGILLQGCVLVTPQPIGESNAPEIAVPMYHYGNITLFEELRVPLQVAIVPAASMNEPSLIAAMQKYLQQSDVKCAAPGAPCDVRININSIYRVLTAAPQCRLSHTMIISTTAADGTKILPERKWQAENQQAVATEALAKAKLLPLIDRNIQLWERNYFRKETGKRLKVTILRFKMSKNLIELNPIHFERDLINVNKRLRSIKGVSNVRMIEVDKKTRLVAFRVLHHSNVNLKYEINKQK